MNEMLNQRFLAIGDSTGKVVTARMSELEEPLSPTRFFCPADNPDSGARVRTEEHGLHCSALMI